MSAVLAAVMCVSVGLVGYEGDWLAGLISYPITQPIMELLKSQNIGLLRFLINFCKLPIFDVYTVVSLSLSDTHTNDHMHLRKVF